jgi:murein L,D-transpeptidase YcbB/YkuD
MFRGNASTPIGAEPPAVLFIRRQPIRWTSAGGCFWQVFACFLILVLPAAGQDAVSQIKAEATRLQQSLKDKPVSISWFPNANSALDGDLKSVKEAADAGRLYLSLLQLEGLAQTLQGARTAEEKKAETAKSGFPEFETEWKRVSLDVEALDQKAQGRNWADAPAALRALSETARAKAVPLLESGRGFATAQGPEEGLNYLGQAQGEAQFAEFCASLDLKRKGAPNALRSMLPELQKLQDKTNAAFQPPRSIELQSTFITLNSALKLGEELDAERLYAGALFQYLVAVWQYGLLDAATPGPARQSELNRAMAQMQKQLDASGYDDSIAQIVLEHAQSDVRHADGSAPTQDDWKSAAVIIDQVLPAYFAAKQPPAAQPRVSGKAVDLTLVRWPYT